MSRFFINRPIVAMVISIVMVIVGIVSFLSLPVAQYPNLVDPQVDGEHELRGRGCLDRGADGRNANRAADEWCGSHELHVFPECEQRWHDGINGGFQCGHRSEHRLGAGPNAGVAGLVATAFQCPRFWRYGGKIDFSAADGHFLIFAHGPVRFEVPGELRHILI